MNAHDILRNKITKIITQDLTITRKDIGYPPYTTEIINKLIEDWNEEIEKTIQIIINDYHSGKFDELEQIQNDKIEKYLYEEVDIVPYLYY